MDELTPADVDAAFEEITSGIGPLGPTPPSTRPAKAAAVVGICAIAAFPVSTPVAFVGFLVLTAAVDRLVFLWRCRRGLVPTRRVR